MRKKIFPPRSYLPNDVEAELSGLPTPAITILTQTTRHQQQQHLRLHQLHQQHHHRHQQQHHQHHHQQQHQHHLSVHYLVQNSDLGVNTVSMRRHSCKNAQTLSWLTLLGRACRTRKTIQLKRITQSRRCCCFDRGVLLMISRLTRNIPRHCGIVSNN